MDLRSSLRRIDKDRLKHTPELKTEVEVKDRKQ